MKICITVEGMHCAHCKARVEAALTALPGVRAHVNLAKKEAVVHCPAETTDEALRHAVEEAGFTVGDILVCRTLLDKRDPGDK